MRKILFFILILLASIGAMLHYDLARKVIEKQPFSIEYRRLNTCGQLLTWFPIASIGGLALMLMPQKTVIWMIKPLSPRYQKTILDNINYFAFRFVGFFMVLTIPIRGLIQNCGTLIDAFSR